MKPETLKEALRSSYTSETCYPGELKDWTPERPGIGHCGVTALVVFQFLGGEILETKYSHGRAFHNRLPDGTIDDFTGEGGHEIKGVTRVRDPKELLRSHTKARFNVLFERVREKLETD